MKFMKFSHVTFCLVRAFVLITLLLSTSVCLAATPENDKVPKLIRVVMDDNYPPYVLKDGQGQLKGILIDQWKLWEKKTGIHAEITGMDWDEAQRRMQAGEFDVIDTIFRNEKREKIYDFSKPYAVIPVPLFFHSDISGIRGPEDAAGFMVAAKAGGNVLDVLRKHGVSNIVEYPSFEKIIQAARDGKVKVFTVDRPPALYYLNKMGIQDDFHETKPLNSGELHRAVLKGQTDLLSTVDNGFASIAKADYEVIDKRWLGSPLLSSPNLRYVLYTAGVVALLVLLLMFWLWLLKRLVARKTRELSESEEHHRSILQTAMNGIWLVDMQGRLIEVNDAYCRMSGYSEQELLTMTVSDLEALESVDDTADHIQKLKECGQVHFESRHRRKDGTIFDVEVSAQYQAADGGQCVSFIQDITERKQTEREKSEVYLRFKGIMDSLDSLIYVADMETYEVLFVNEFGKNLFGEIEGHICWQALQTDQSGPCAFCTNDRLIRADGEPAEVFEWEFQNTVNGRWYQCRDKAIRWHDNRLVRMENAIDITERKHFEEERVKLESHLRQAQKMESVGLLAGGVAHDFNNMLGVILGHVSLALKKTDPAQPLRANLEEIRKAAERSADLTRQLLAFARKQTIAPKVLDLNETVASMLNMLHRLIGEGIHLAWQPAATLWPVKLDPSQIDQILANLCVNARDSISGVGKITIETGNRVVDENFSALHLYAQPGEYITLTVSDDGCGMDKETLAHIFEPFFTTKGPGEGTGLGLSTVFGAVKQNNGFIDVESESGLGTRFTIYLPRDVGKIEQAGTINLAEPFSLGHEIILVVEDEPAILNLAVEVLTEFGYTVLAANSPGEAIRMAKECAGEIHLLMTDVVMPEMNGLDLAKNLQSLYPQLKCLFMSGYTADVIAHHGVLDDDVYFVQKPFSLSDLATKVRVVLDSE